MKLNKNDKKGAYRDTSNYYKDAMLLYEALSSITYKKEFDDSVTEYKDLMSYYKSNRHNVNYYSNFIGAGQQDQNNRLGVVQPSNMIEEHALAYMNLIWDFNTTPFSIKHFLETENTEDVKDFYSDVRTTLNLHLKSPSCNFKTAFQQFVRSWVEYGVGIFEVRYFKDSFRCVTHSPENVQYEHDERGRLRHVLIKDYDSRLSVHSGKYKGSGDKRKEILTHYELVYSGHDCITKEGGYTPKEVSKEESKVKFHWFRSVYTPPSEEHPDGIIEVMHKIKYTPTFIACHNQQLGSNVGLGRGLEALCIIRILNNIAAQMEEAVSKKLSPLALVNGLHLFSEESSNKLGALLFESKASVLQPNSPTFEQVNWQFDISDAITLYSKYQDDLVQLLSRNKMVDEKGRARMTGQEFAARDNYDTTHYTSNSSTLIDIFLKPMLKNLTAFVSTFRGLDTIPDLIKDEMTGMAMFDEVEITIENYINNLEGESRKKSIIDGMQMVAMIADTQAKITQAGGQAMDFSAVINEVKDLANLKLTPESEASQSYEALTADMKYLENNRA